MIFFKQIPVPTADEVPKLLQRVADRQRRFKVAGIVTIIGMLGGFVVGGGTEQYLNCRSGNTYRRNDLSGWEQAANTLDPSRLDARTVSLLDFQEKKDRQRNCSPL